MTNKFVPLLLSLLLAVASPVIAGTESEGNGNALSDEMLTRLRTAYPSTQFDAVRPSEIPGLFEVSMGRNVAYVEPKGRYFLFGHLYDLPANDDITARRQSELPAVKMVLSCIARSRRRTGWRCFPIRIAAIAVVWKRLWPVCPTSRSRSICCPCRKARRRHRPASGVRRIVRPPGSR